MMLWALPAVLEGVDLAGFCAPGSLVDRVIKAGRSASRGAMVESPLVSGPS